MINGGISQERFERLCDVEIKHTYISRWPSASISSSADDPTSPVTSTTPVTPATPSQQRY